MKKENIINRLTLENFAFPKVGTYSLNTNSGEVIIEITERLSKYGSGKQTVCSGEYNGIKIVRKPIGYWKKQFGAVVNHRDGFAKTVKVLTEDEIAKVVTNYEAKVVGALESLNKLISLASENAEKVTYNVESLCGLFRDNLNDKNAKAKAEKEANDKANAEKAEKAERRELAKKVTDFDDMQKALLEAIANKDFAKVAELSAQMQSA